MLQHFYIRLVAAKDDAQHSTCAISQKTEMWVARKRGTMLDAGSARAAADVAAVIEHLQIATAAVEEPNVCSLDSLPWH